MEEMKQFRLKNTDVTAPEYPVYCSNPAVDAVAVLYQKEAEREGILISWNISLPSRLPVEETKFCLIMRNLLDYAFLTVQEVEPSDRWIVVSAGMAGDHMMGIEIRNRYKEEVHIGINNSLIVKGKPCKPMGLMTAAAEVRDQNGIFMIDLDDHLICVEVLLNIPFRPGENLNFP